ncbi:MAG: DegT/DnrJ/EryC1/StrS family aminotransferase [Candidatus Omnitrophica bacterium]|nr:DegT/DnrJ/EryC1/StrS family aminotransferase [Candidatus Omnitrophota bacterium]
MHHSPVRTKPWLDNITTGPEELDAVKAVMRDGYLSLFEGSHAPEPPFSFWGGPRVQELERQWAAAYGARHAVSMNSATSGLLAAIGALGLGFGDEVIVSPLTMTAAASCPLFYGAIPIFADVRRETGSVDPESIVARITPRTRAVIVVHQFGIPADMDPILAIAKRHGLRVVEDCAQAHGALYRGRPVGTLGDIGVFSLNVNKTIQAGEGGVCLTNDDDLRYRLALIRNHGEAVVGPAGYEAITNIIGLNLRLTELPAAIASEQLKKLAGLNAARLCLVEALSRALAPHGFLIPPPACSHAAFGQAGSCGCRSTYYLYPVRLRREALEMPRAEFARLMRAEGIIWHEGYTRPLYLQPLYQRRIAFKRGYPFAAPENQSIQTNYYAGACPAAESLSFEELLVNEHVRPPHTLDDVMDIARAVERVSRRG